MSLHKSVLQRSVSMDWGGKTTWVNLLFLELGEIPDSLVLITHHQRHVQLAGQSLGLFHVSLFVSILFSCL
jgi:hypothetical protein